MTPPRPDVPLTAFRNQLRAAGVACEIGQKPADGGWAGGTSAVGAFTPYVILWPTTGAPEGTLGDVYTDLLLEFQASAIGETGAQAMQLQGTVRDRLYGPPPTVDGFVIQPPWQVSAPPLSRDDDVSPPLFLAAAVYQARIGPA